MTTDITPPLLRSVAAWCNTQTDPNVDAFARADAAVTLSSLADGLEHSAATEAVDLDVAILIADTVDGTPDDYMDAAKAIREHYAGWTPPADDVVDAEVQCGFALITGSSGRWECVLPHGHDGSHRTPAPVPEPPVGTRLRDKDGEIWRRENESDRGWRGNHYAFTNWPSLIKHHGPLHQVWTDLDEVPAGTRFRCADGLVALRTGVSASSIPRTAAAAPFVAVAEFGAEQ